MKNGIPTISKNTVRLIAAAAMLADHIGAAFFPDLIILRIIGRLAFPVFAYGIFEGCKYTKNKLNYFLRLFILGAVCVAVFYVYDRTLYLNILITFSLSALIIFSLKFALSRRGNPAFFGGLGLTLLSLVFSFVICSIFTVDYGFAGVTAPVFAAVADEFGKLVVPKGETNSKYIPLIGFSVGLVTMCVISGGIQYWSLFALILLFISDREKNRLRLKYFFYIFYPAHLAVIGIISMLIQ